QHSLHCRARASTSLLRFLRLAHPRCPSIVPPSSRVLLVSKTHPASLGLLPARLTDFLYPNGPHRFLDQPIREVIDFVPRDEPQIAISVRSLVDDGETDIPLPALARLVLEHCQYGVDVSASYRLLEGHE